MGGAHVHLVHFAPTVQKRVISSTLEAGSYQVTEVVAAADLMRATLAYCHGMLDHDDWETSAASWDTSRWPTGCRSCYDTLQRPTMRNIDKGLGIEFASVRQFLWRRRGSGRPGRRLLDNRPAYHTDTCRDYATQSSLSLSLCRPPWRCIGLYLGTIYARRLRL